MRALLVASILAASTLFGARTTLAVPCPSTIGARTTCHQAKIFPNLGGTLPGATGLTISVATLGRLDIHNVAFDYMTLPGGLLDNGPITYALDYAISVDTALAPNSVLNDVSDSRSSKDRNQPLRLAGGARPQNVTGHTRNLFGDGDIRARSRDGGVDVTVHETFTVGANGLIFNSTNIDTEVLATVSAPATVVVLGLGLIIVGFGMRRQTRSGGNGPDQPPPHVSRQEHGR